MKMKKFQAALIDDRLNVRTEKSQLNKVKIEKKLFELKERTIKLQDILISGTLLSSDYLTIKTCLEAEFSIYKIKSFCENKSTRLT